MAFLTYIHLYATDLVRATKGKSSILFERPWTPVDQLDDNLSSQLSALIAQPLWGLLFLLEFWALRSGRLGTGILNTPSAPEGRVWTLGIPPIWRPFAKIRNLSDKESASPKIPVLVESALRPLIEQFVAFVQAGSHAKLHLTLNAGPPEEFTYREQARTPETIPAVLQQLSDSRIINWRGQRVHFTPLQVQIIAILYESHRDGMPEVPHDYIIAQLNHVNGRLKDMFRSRPGILGTLILRTRPGYWRLHPDFLQQCGIPVKA